MFSPARAVLQLLRAKLAVIAERHQLKQYFREAHSVSATYGENILSPEIWEQDKTGFQSTSYWPWVYLCCVIRSSKPVRCRLSDSETEVRGTVHTVEDVYLTLGWDPAGWVVGYLELLPGLAVQSYEFEDTKPSFNFRCSGETFTEGCVNDVSFVIDDGESITIPDSAKDWPFRLRSRIRFERLTPQQLAFYFLDCRRIQTAEANIVPDIDTSAVISPPDSTLAMMEAQLLGREATWPHRTIPSFLNELEEKIIHLTTTFREWRKNQQESARRDYLAELESVTKELGDLKKSTR